MSVLTMTGVTKTFRGSRRRVVAVDEVSLVLDPSQTVALVGESGCGKSTLGQLAVGLLTPDRGRIVHDGVDLATGRARRLRGVRPRLQLVFQSSGDAFAPHLRLGRGLRAIAAAMDEDGSPQERVAEVLEQVGLDQTLLDRLPDQLSGGQLQRVALARALLARPRLIVADEVVSALDVATQDEITHLLGDLQGRWGFGLLLITHDLGVARQIADQVVVMESGRVVEEGPVDQVLTCPVSPAARRLVSAVPRFAWG